MRGAPPVIVVYDVKGEPYKLSTRGRWQRIKPKGKRNGLTLYQFSDNKIKEEGASSNATQAAKEDKDSHKPKEKRAYGLSTAQALVLYATPTGMIAYAALRMLQWRWRLRQENQQLRVISSVRFSHTDDVETQML